MNKYHIILLSSLFFRLLSHDALAHVNHLQLQNAAEEEEKKAETPAKTEPTVVIIPDAAPTPNTNVDFVTDVFHFKPHNSASEKQIRAQDIKMRPIARPADVLQITPGLYVIQHAGGGKANQYFLRGFDLDHGTDIDLRFDGIPINYVSHGHGQGYADANFVMPELISNIDVLKGPYRGDQGDMAMAGSIRLHSRNSFEKNTTTVSYGDFDTSRLFFGLSPKLEGYKTLMAGEIYKTNGPFENDEKLERFNLFAKLTRNPSSNSKLTFSSSLYSSDWNASNLIPLRAVERGEIKHFGYVDPTDGGQTQRNHFAVDYLLAEGDDVLEFNIYSVKYAFNLFSNFTFFSGDSTNGDQIEQVDSRRILGSQLRFKHDLSGAQHNQYITFGASWRQDQIANGLYASKARERRSTTRNHDIEQTNIGMYVEHEMIWSKWLATVVGMRADHFTFLVQDKNETLNDTGTRTSGRRGASVLQPKGNLILSPNSDWNIFLNYGKGFHSNDARGTSNSSNPVSPIASGHSYEIGQRQYFLNRQLTYSLSGFLIEMKDERVWVGDEGTSENKAASQRRGVELEARYSPKNWLSFDFDLSYNQGRLLGVNPSADSLPLAPKIISNAGINVRNVEGMYGRFGMFYLGDRYASEDRYFTAEGFTRFDLTAGKTWSAWDWSLSIQNLFDAKIREAQFVNTSKLANESTDASCTSGSRADNSSGFVGCEDIHYTPGLPFFISTRLTYLF